jgi:phosphate ABC transporter phosphate-binding protein
MSCHYIRYLYIVYKFYVDLLYNHCTLISYTKTRIKNMNTKYAIVVAIVAIAIILGSVVAYIYLSGPSASTPSITLQGAGATFPYPLLNSMVTNYTTNVKPNVQINYQPIGSGGGISAYKLSQATVDFAASDAPLTAADSANVPNALHIPETIGAVTIAYNLPGVSSGLHLTGPVIADIFQGKITMWNDPAIQNLNPSTTLPSQGINTVHRSDGSGTTFIFTSYLSKSSTSWNSSVGQGKSVAWPVGIGSSGNTGVASSVQGNQYSIGYVELAYTLENNMTVAAVQNPSGNWVLPSLDSTQLAVQSGASTGLPPGNASWTSVSLLNAPDANAYPIVSFTYLIVYKELNVLSDMTNEKATALVQFLWYVVHDGQNLAPGLSYAKLPSNVVQIDETTIESITFNGQQLPAT